jgi:hypothetical protein
VPEEAAGAAEPVAGGGVAGAAVTLGLAGAVAVRLGKLPIELLMVPPHPAASNPAASRVAGRESLFAERRMLILPRRVWPAAGASDCRRQGSLSRVPGRLGRPGLVIGRLPGWADSASDTIVTVRRRAWGQIRRFRRRVPLLHPASGRVDHGGQHSQDGSQQERDSRRQVPVSAEVADVRALAVFQDEDQQEQQFPG